MTTMRPASLLARPLLLLGLTALATSPIALSGCWPEETPQADTGGVDLDGDGSADGEDADGATGRDGSQAATGSDADGAAGGSTDGSTTNGADGTDGAATDGSDATGNDPGDEDATGGTPSDGGSATNRSGGTTSSSGSNRSGSSTTSGSTSSSNRSGSSSSSSSAGSNRSGSSSTNRSGSGSASSGSNRSGSSSSSSSSGSNRSGSGSSSSSGSGGGSNRTAASSGGSGSSGSGGSASNSSGGNRTASSGSTSGSNTNNLAGGGSASNDGGTGGSSSSASGSSNRSTGGGDGNDAVAEVDLPEFDTSSVVPARDRYTLEEWQRLREVRDNIVMNEPGPGTDPGCYPRDVMPMAEKGKLTKDQVSCIQASLTNAEYDADKARLSLVLITNAHARTETDNWEWLVQRHLEDIDEENPGLSYRFAIHLYQSGPEKHLDAYRWAGVALGQRAAWSGAIYHERVTRLYKVRSALSQSMWRSAEQDFANDPSEDNRDNVLEWRDATRKAALEWYRYAEETEMDTQVAYKLCAIASIQDGCEGVDQPG